MLLKKYFRHISIITLNYVHRSRLSTNTMSVFLENVFAVLCKKTVRFKYSAKERIFRVIEHDIQLTFRNKIRGFWLYRGGIKNRGEFLHKSYCLHNINFLPDDIVIDCGANSGDLFLSLKQRIRHCNYIAIEPNPSDFEVLEKNVGHKAKLINKGLGNQNKILPFYVSTAQGDSSIIEPVEFEKIIKIDVQRGDKLISELNITEIKLLKLEAEGFEPEILKGFGKEISKVEFIAVDGGYERGTNAEQTLTTITNYLLENGFYMRDVYLPWCRALYQRHSK